MAKTQQFKIDATRPFYAVVGAGDLAVELARSTATDVQTRFAKVELEPKSLRDQAVTIVATRTEELTKDAKSRAGPRRGAPGRAPGGGQGVPGQGPGQGQRADR